MSELAERIARLTPAQQELLRLRAQRPPAAREGIAVIGLACRFPGAPDSASYWSLLERGGDAITTIPPSRWPVEDFYDPRPATPGRMNTRWGGLIEGCDDFDPAFFGIAPREAERMDPQQRLLLEVAWQALEDAGVPASALAGSASGVFIAVCGGDFGRAQAQDYQRIDAYVATGGAASIAANRLSYFLDLRGPSLAVDTACSSSLVALHLACRSLRQGECDLALVGGVNLLLAPEMTIAFSQAHMMAGDGRCKTFDAAADGYVRSEGCGVVVLRRLADARSGGDRIRAVVRGTAVNQDGRSNGLTAPNGPAQQAVIGQCLADAGIGAGEVGYVELHGTGTPLGDPIEVHALKQALMPGRAGAPPLLIGAVKANIGHLEAAAGMAGMIKVILSMERGVIPRQLHLATLNPRIDLGGGLLAIPHAPTPWPQPAGARLAGVSSFGFGGTNAHVILGDPAPAAAPAPAPRARALQLLPLSARSAPALRALARSWSAALAAPGAPPLAQACALAQLGRVAFEHRLALVAPTAAVAAGLLSRLADGEAAPGATANQLAPGRRPPGVAFLFTGQGAQYAGMGRGLYEQEPVFRAALDQCAEICRPLLPHPLLAVMHAGGPAGALDQTACTQPALFSLSYALCRLWQSWGVQPGALLGHSVGEYAAACIAGVHGLGDALTLICARARLMQALPAGGAMAAVFAGSERVEELIARAGAGVALAAVNAPLETVVSGGEAEVGRLLAAAAAAGLSAARLKVSHAFHSPLLEAMLPEFAAVCARIPAGRPAIPLVSNLSGGFAGDELLAGPDYWVRHARGTVRFADGVRALHARGFRVFLEVGPQPTLITLGRRVLGEQGAEWLSSLHQGRDDGAQLLGCLARLQVLGVAVDWQGFGARRAGSAVTMPGYPFERLPMHSCPLPLPLAARAPGAPGAAAAAQEAQAPVHIAAASLLGPRLSSPVSEPAQYAARISLAGAPWLADHRVFGAALLPATAYLAMAQAAAGEHGMARATLEQVTISRPLTVPDDGRTLVQLVLSAAGTQGRPGFQVFSREAGAAGGAPWILHAQGGVRAAAAAPAELPSWPQALAGCPEPVDVAAFYAALASRGFAYGPAFQGVQRAWRGAGIAAGEVALPPALRAAAGTDAIHPALLDACCQLLGALVPEDGAGHGGLFVPVGLEELALFAPVAPEVRVVAALRPAALAHGGVLVGDIHLFDAAGRCCARIAALRLARVTREALLGHAPAAPAAPAAPVAASPRTLPPLRRELAAAEAAGRRARLRAFLVSRIATILGRSDEQIDAEQPLNSLGFDSLMAGELSLDIEDHLGIIVPMERFREVPNIELITTLLLAQLEEEEGRTAGLVAAVDAMSDDEVERELRARLVQAGR